MILLDTNVLGRFTSKADPQGQAVRRGIPALLAQQKRLVIVPQNLYEFWAVATRKRGSPPTGQNGLGMTGARSSQWMRFFQRRFPLLVDKSEIVKLWHDLVSAHGILGVKSHDARLVAAMQSYGITRLLSKATYADCSREAIYTRMEGE